MQPSTTSFATTVNRKRLMGSEATVRDAGEKLYVDVTRQRQEWWRSGRMSTQLSQEIDLFVRSKAQLPRAKAAVKAAVAESVELNDQLAVEAGRVAIGTMNLAKGLELRAVAVMASTTKSSPCRSALKR